jgi:hypothetical protein
MTRQYFSIGVRFHYAKSTCSHSRQICVTWSVLYHEVDVWTIATSLHDLKHRGLPGSSFTGSASTQWCVIHAKECVQSFFIICPFSQVSNERYFIYYTQGLINHKTCRVHLLGKGSIQNCGTHVGAPLILSVCVCGRGQELLTHASKSKGLAVPLKGESINVNSQNNCLGTNCSLSQL